MLTLEGADGVGKSTQALRLTDRLRQAGREVVRTREPGGTPGAERLRMLLLEPDLAWGPWAETLLHLAARADHVALVIEPALAAGRWVVCDRFSDSTLAYQGYGQGCDIGRIAILVGQLGVIPDLTLVLDVAPDVARTRLAARIGGLDRYERLGEAFFARVRAGFRAIAAADPGRCVVIDADGEPDRVAQAIWGIVQARLG